jgi:DNA-3-methyladenine glycosylase
MESLNILPKDFYYQSNVQKIAKKLLGKLLVTNLGGVTTSGWILETEAYAGIKDKASHAYNNRRTKRTETMYKSGGIAYVYLIYGIHHLLNVVTNQAEIPHAVLIRSIQPFEGIKSMEKRRGKAMDKKFSSGPGTLSQALGIHTMWDGETLQGPNIWIEDRGLSILDTRIEKRPRIGVEYAEDHAHLPWNYRIDSI